MIAPLSFIQGMSKIFQKEKKALYNLIITLYIDAYGKSSKIKEKMNKLLIFFVKPDSSAFLTIIIKEEIRDDRAG